MKSVTPGADFFFVVGMIQLFIWMGFVIHVMTSKKKDPISLVFGSAVILLLALAATAIGCIIYF